MSRRRPSKHGRPRITGRAIVLGVMVVGLLVAAAYPFRTFLAERASISSLQGQARNLQSEDARLARRIHSLNDPSTIERLARECLGMVRPGEISFVILPRGKSGPKAPC